MSDEAINSTVSTTLDAEPAHATIIPLAFDATLLRGREAELIEASWDGEAMLSLKGMRAFGMRDHLTVATHPGAFHQDEVVAIALLVNLLAVDPSKLTVIRTRNVDDVAECDFVVDTCVGLLDHHDERDDKVSAAASRVYRLLYNTDQVRSQAEPMFWENLAAFVDAVCRQDNGAELNPRLGYVHTLSRLERITGEPQFEKALKRVIEDLHDMILCWMAEANATAAAQRVIDSCPKATVLLFPKDCAACYVKELMWQSSHPAIYYVSPENDADWRINCAAPPREHADEQFNPFASRFLLPEEWRGKRADELSRITGIPGAIFTHAKGFTAGWNTRKGAMMAAMKAVEALTKEG